MNRTTYNFIYILILAGSILVVFPSQASALTLTMGEQQFVVPANTVNSWKGSFSVPSHSNLKISTGSYQAIISDYLGLPVKKDLVRYQAYQYNPKQVYSYINDLAKNINQEASEPSLQITDGKVEEFTPPEEGITVDTYTSALTMLKTLSEKNAESPLSTSTVAPQNSLASMNDLGINELIAQGTSNFSGSPSNRKHNISVGVSKFKGVIIKPGEEFSFNKYLGPVEAEQGYKPELVIKAEGTIPELGGGLCQVSSTVFRAAMKAGLPITQRRNHAYAVQYYAPQGTDATIYPGVIDLKFINDTPASILVWPELKEGSNLTFDFYGTKDDRKVTLNTPVQFDKKSDGSMKASWKRTMTKNGETESETFSSIYRSPALYHKKEEFVPATPPASTPESPTIPSEPIGNSVAPVQTPQN